MLNKNEALQNFVNGTAFDIYNFLGAHKSTVNKEKGYMFRVWAPNARHVALAGDFTGGDSPQPMVKVTEAGVWETCVDGKTSFVTAVIDNFPIFITWG